MVPFHYKKLFIVEKKFLRLLKSGSFKGMQPECEFVWKFYLV